MLEHGFQRVTASLEQELDDRGWTGIRWVDQNSRPEDFAESQLFPATALDEVYGDNATLSVYAGHGNVDLWQWGTPSDEGACVLTMSTSVRLGSLAGDRARVVMSLTSCTGMATELWPTFGQTSRARQILAYHNSPAIWNNQPRKFLRASVDGMSNRLAWLSVMANRPGLGHNSPSVLTVGVSPEDALAFHSAARLGGLTELSAPPENAEYYVLSYLDYGCGPCGCPGQADGGAPWLEPQEVAIEIGEHLGAVPDPSPRLLLERIERSPVELALRVAELLELAEVAPATGRAIEAWASEVEPGSDGAHVLRVDGPGLAAWVLYTPREDDLLVVVERAESRGFIDQADAQVRFRQLVQEAQSRGLIANVDIADPRVGRVVTEIGGGDGVIAQQVEGWSFSANRSQRGLAVLDAGLSAMIGLDGRPWMVRLTDVHVQDVGLAERGGSGTQLAQAWSEALESWHRSPDLVSVDMVRAAYVIDPSVNDVVVEPRLIVNYVLGYEGPDGLMPSRQNILALSIADAPTAASLLP